MDSLSTEIDSQVHKLMPTVPKLNPTVQKLTPTVHKLIPTVQKMIPTVQKSIPIVQKLIPTVQRLIPTSVLWESICGQPGPPSALRARQLQERLGAALATPGPGCFATWPRDGT